MKYVYDPEHSRPKHTSVSVSQCAYAVCLFVSVSVFLSYVYALFYITS